jgi:hypothetical protein
MAARGYTEEQLYDPETSIRLFAEVVYSVGWGDWGEGRLYNGRPFGALGNHPYPGDHVWED